MIQEVPIEKEVVREIPVQKVVEKVIHDIVEVVKEVPITKETIKEIYKQKVVPKYVEVGAAKQHLRARHYGSSTSAKGHSLPPGSSWPLHVSSREGLSRGRDICTREEEYAAVARGRGVCGRSKFSDRGRCQSL